ncbi:PREDICTED: ankyrin repeat and SAM domain-containing protein 3-like, partial [Priapulus caudatus]|uniref:Ankyrin repeat and SAM domain-containing protein 3-like n=1 Tax=Priapulus caudatus TaxID=37621 RepID=A0ABM1F7C4_PRICU
MTSAIARWHSNVPLSTNAPEQAYADKLEAEMQEMAIQLHQVCAQLESMKQQVLQERELRSVVEGCLMEDRAAWQRLQHTSSEASTVCRNMTAAMINM